MSMNRGIRNAMIFGAILIFGGGSIALVGLGWSIFSAGTSEVRVWCGILSAAYLAWLVTLLVKNN